MRPQVIIALSPGEGVIVTGINDRGQIVGVSEGPNGDSQGFIYSEGAFQTVQIPGSNTALVGINNAGEVLGYAVNSQGVDQPFLYTGEKGVQFLPNFRGTAAAINNLGQIVGVSSNGAAESVFLYTNGAVTPITTLTSAYITGFNDAGEIIGYQSFGDFEAFGYRGFAYESGNFTLFSDDSFAYAVNDSGQIVGYSLNGNRGDVLATPIPEAPPLGAMVIGFSVCVFLRRCGSAAHLRTNP